MNTPIGSSRSSPRDRRVAEALRERSLGTLLGERRARLRAELVPTALRKRK
jgi:hypothetical protein